MTKETKTCTFCGEEILATAKKCKHCKQFIEDNNENSTETGVLANNGVPVSNEELAKMFKDKKIIVIAGVVIIIMIIGYIYNSSNSLLAGCTLESSGAMNLSTYANDYSCNNKYYKSVHVSSNMSAQYPNYYIGENSMVRQNGEYVCSIYCLPDKIHGCNEAMFKKLLIKHAKENADLEELNTAKFLIGQAIHILEIKEDDLITKRLREIDRGVPLENRTPIDVKNLIEMFGDEVVEQRGNQIRLDRGEVISISDDIKSATIYDNYENPKYYTNVKIKFEEVTHGVTEAMHEYTDECIPADKFIKNTEKLHKFTAEDMSK